jgi:hypothetical protein
MSHQQEQFSKEPFDKHQVNKLFFKKPSPYLKYADAMFNGGVYTNGEGAFI